VVQYQRREKDEEHVKLVSSANWKRLLSMAALVVLSACKAEATEEPVPSWSEVTAGLKDLSLRPIELGTVEHFEVTRGLSEDLRLLKVRVSKRELATFLAPFQIAAKALNKCERKAFPSWGKSARWKLQGGSDFRCGGTEWSVPGGGEPWLLLAFVARAEEGDELAHVALYRGR
jgi:hypothetical protein